MDAATPAPDTPALIELRGATKRFVKPLDFAAKIGRRLGANLREEVVRAVDNATWRCSPAKWWGW